MGGAVREVLVPLGTGMGTGIQIQSWRKLLHAIINIFG